MKSHGRKILVASVAMFIFAVILFHPAQKMLSASFYGSCTSTITSKFIDTKISGDSYIYFNASLIPSGQLKEAGTVAVSSYAVTFTVNGTEYSCYNNYPVQSVAFSDSVTTARLTYNAWADGTDNFWTLSVPLGLTGNMLLTPCMFKVPAGGLPAGIYPVNWSMTFESTVNQAIDWQWGAAVYTELPWDNITLPGEGGHGYGLLQAKPTEDGNVYSQNCTVGAKNYFNGCYGAYANSDPAGTPEGLDSSGEPWKDFVVAGATGSGGSNWTGSLSGTGSCTPVPPK
jgi:hypothetical protein